MRKPIAAVAVLAFLLFHGSILVCPAAPAGKVALANINTNFVQKYGSCVLASYSVVANYYTGQPITNFFAGYCKHFGLSFTNARDAELKYAIHFDAEWKKRHCKGYEVILDLHSNATEKCFAEARKAFDARFILDSRPLFAELEKSLHANEAFLTVSYSGGREFHSVAVMADGDHFGVRDTNRKDIYPVDHLGKIGKLSDCVEYNRRAPAP